MNNLILGSYLLFIFLKTVVHSTKKRKIPISLIQKSVNFKIVKEEKQEKNISWFSSIRKWSIQGKEKHSMLAENLKRFPWMDFLLIMNTA